LRLVINNYRTQKALISTKIKGIINKEDLRFKMPAAVSALEKTKPTISIVGAKKTVKTVLITYFFYSP
jgi:hypothetical protein